MEHKEKQLKERREKVWDCLKAMEATRQRGEREREKEAQEKVLACLQDIQAEQERKQKFNTN